VALRFTLPILLVLCAAPAMAQDSPYFQSPTGNIVCGVDRWEGETWVRCDMRDLVQSYTSPPLGCDLDWGTSFTVGETGKGMLTCHGDTLLSPNEPILRYGDAMALGGVSCVSAKTGMTCTNADGHGFTIAKAKQKLF
jgi:hypothetical protein